MAKKREKKLQQKFQKGIVERKTKLNFRKSSRIGPWRISEKLSEKFLRENKNKFLK